MITVIDGVNERVVRIMLQNGKEVDKRIKFYSLNTNILPQTPKSYIRHLKNFIESMSLIRQTRPQIMLLSFVGFTTLTH